MGLSGDYYFASARMGLTAIIIIYYQMNWISKYDFNRERSPHEGERY